MKPHDQSLSPVTVSHRITCNWLRKDLTSTIREISTYHHPSCWMTRAKETRTQIFGLFIHHWKLRHEYELDIHLDQLRMLGSLYLITSHNPSKKLPLVHFQFNIEAFILFEWTEDVDSTESKMRMSNSKYGMRNVFTHLAIAVAIQN